jgi:hypothetical protein
MAEFVGSALVIKWIYSGGTVDLTADYRKFSYTPKIQTFEVSASSEVINSYITGLTDFTATYEGLAQKGGTALWDSLQCGTNGTIIVSPEGTASGTRKFTFVAFTVNDPMTDFPYNDVVKTTINWQGNGTLTRGTN